MQLEDLEKGLTSLLDEIPEDRSYCFQFGSEERICLKLFRRDANDAPRQFSYIDKDDIKLHLEQHREKLCWKKHGLSFKIYLVEDDKPLYSGQISEEDI